MSASHVPKYSHPSLSGVVVCSVGASIFVIYVGKNGLFDCKNKASEANFLRFDSDISRQIWDSLLALKNDH